MGWTVFGGARPAAHLNVVECLLNIKTKWVFNAAKWALPWPKMLKSAAQPWTWMFFMAAEHPDKKVHQHREQNWAVFGKHCPTISSNVFEKLRTIQMRRFFNTVKCPGPCLGEHERPFIWTLLNVCITSKRNDSSTPRIELGRDRKNEPWQKKLGSAAQPSTWMCLNGCITSRRKSFSTPWKKLGRVWGSTAQP